MNLSQLFASSPVFAQAATAVQPQPAVWESLMMPLGLLVIMYFFMIRPQMRKNKDRLALLEALKAGDEVNTTAGIIGRVKSVAEGFVVLEIAANTAVKFNKSAIEGLTKDTKAVKEAK